jgi:hypothetical protein
MCHQAVLRADVGRRHDRGRRAVAARCRLPGSRLPQPHRCAAIRPGPPARRGRARTRGHPDARSSALVAKAEEHGILLAAGPEFAPEGGLDRFVRIPYTEPEDVLADAIARLAAAWRDTLSDLAAARRARAVRGFTALVS